jgi:hypothetical protein
MGIVKKKLSEPNVRPILIQDCVTLVDSEVAPNICALLSKHI